MKALVLRLSLEFAKWRQTIAVRLTSHLAYKFDFALYFLGPSLVFFGVKYNLWHAIYASSGATTIQGYDLKQMLAYQAWVLVVSLLGQGMQGVDMGYEIRMGRITPFLLYPFSYWRYQCCDFLALQLIQITVGAVTLAALWAAGLITFVASAVLAGIVMTCAMSFLWFSIGFLVGISGFWLEEIWVLRATLATIITFLSGSLMPLEFYPPWLSYLLKLTPFPYLTAVPTQFFMDGKIYSLGPALGVLALWFGIFSLLAFLGWRRGLSKYTAAGI